MVRESFESQVMAESDARSDIPVRDAFHQKHPALRGVAVHDLKERELIRRPHRNNSGQAFNFAGNEVLQAHVSELGAGQQSVRHRHLTEAFIYIVKGSGFSLMNYEGDSVKCIEWSEGSLFCPPKWAWHQHFNASEGEPSRYLAVQDVLLLKNLRLHEIQSNPVQFSRSEALDLFKKSQASSATMALLGAALDAYPALD